MTRLLALVWPELRAPEAADPVAFERMLDALDDLAEAIPSCTGCPTRSC